MRVLRLFVLYKKTNPKKTQASLRDLHPPCVTKSAVCKFCVIEKMEIAKSQIMCHGKCRNHIVYNNEKTNLPKLHDEMLADQFFTCYRKCDCCISHLFYHSILSFSLFISTPKSGDTCLLWYRTNETVQFNNLNWMGAHTSMYYIQ